MAEVLSYSTEEKVVGTWIDGKPLYKKTYEFGAISAYSVINIDTSATPINKVIKLEGTCYSGAYVPVVYADRSTAGIVSCYWSANKIQVFTGSSRAVNSGTITIFYTKTTD